MEKDCSICCETYNHTKFKKITCNFCEYHSCHQCTQRYLLEIVNDSNCMNCHREWNSDFLHGVLPKSFIHGELKTHREEVLLDREKCLMPESQFKYKQEQKIERKNVQIQKLYAFDKKNKMKDKDLHFTIMDHISRIKRELSQLIEAKEEPKEERRAFVKKCPLNECRGFLSTRYKCGLCSKKICKKCNEEELLNHVCDPANVATVKLLAKDTKGCPKCGTMITKISGCHQMWCPDCQTAFNWDTLRIETGVIHNPHYFEFYIRTGRELPHQGQRPGNDALHQGHLPGGYCENEPLIPHVYYQHNEARDICHLIHFIRVVEINRHVQIDNHDLRVKYLTKEISENEFQTLIQRREKKRLKDGEIKDVLRMFTTTAITILNNGYDSNAFEQLRDFTNEAFEKIGKKYSSKYPILYKSWNYKRV